jgi:hypothetical protein
MSVAGAGSDAERFIVIPHPLPHAPSENYRLMPPSAWKRGHQRAGGYSRKNLIA